MKRAAALVLAATLSACAGPRVQTASVAPVVAAPNWRTDTGTVAPLDRAWWQGFGDPVLTTLIERALANNTDIGIAVARVREARANVAVARAQLFPTLDGGFSAARTREVDAFGLPQKQTAAEPQVQLGYEVDLFGRIADQRSAARDAYLASAAARDAVRLSVAGATASGYLTLRGLDARLDVARSTLAARAESLRIAQSRVRHGYSPKLELEQAQAEYDATAQIVPQIQLAITRAEDALSVLVGELPADTTRGVPIDRLAVPSVPDTLPAELLRRRPDVAQAEYQLAATDSSLAAARKRFLPQVRLSAAAGAAFSTLLPNPLTVWSVGGSVLAPLFSGGRLTAQADAAGAQRDQAAFAYRRVALVAFRDVEDALAAVRRLDEQVALGERQRDSLAEGLRLATNRYREGYSPYLEQLDAQRGLLGAQLALIQTRSDALAARVQLYQAMGGGWSADDLDQASTRP